MSVQTPSPPMLLKPETLTGQYIEGSDEPTPSQPFLPSLASNITSGSIGIINITQGQDTAVPIRED
jgi:hypothetical protein